MSDFDQYLDDAMKATQREDRARQEQDESDRRRLRQAEARAARAEQVAQQLCLAAATRLEQAAVPQMPIVETDSRNLRFPTLLGKFTPAKPEYRSTTYRKTGEVWEVGGLYLDREGNLLPGHVVDGWAHLRTRRGAVEKHLGGRNVRESVEFDPPTLRDEAGAVIVYQPVHGEGRSEIALGASDWDHHVFELGDDDVVRLVTLSHRRDVLGVQGQAVDLGPWLARAVAALIS